jgi:putative radical SAM enzyme (TIGR03279 family)
MPLKIAGIQPRSLAAAARISPGDQIISINSHLIRDFIDFLYYQNDDELNIQLITDSGQKKAVQLFPDNDLPLGIEPELYKCRNCINNCIFCFIDQMRPDIRDSLYIKDDDYLLSFSQGNFITLTNLNDKDFSRIIAQKLSPLYISVHTTNPHLHKRMMRYKRDFDILEKLRLLADNRIELHTQIVVVPDWNDGDELKKTLIDLTSEPILAASVGIVPVGLTRFRDKQLKIKSVNKSLARQIIAESVGHSTVYCADEIFLMAEYEIPGLDYYQDFPQLENGIGMIRLFWENWKRAKTKFIRFLRQRSEKLLFITAELAHDVLQTVSNEINEILPDKTRVVKIENNFLGHTVTVAGLMAAQDIFKQVSLQTDEIPVLPRNFFNYEDISIDNFTLSEIRKKFGSSLMIIDTEFEDWHIA